MFNSLREWWHKFLEDTAPRDPEKLFGRPATLPERAEKILMQVKVFDEEKQGISLGDGWAESRIGERIRMRVGFSEAVTHLHIDGTLCEALVTPSGVQFFDDNGKPFSFPVTHAEAGLMESNGRLWYQSK